MNNDQTLWQAFWNWNVLLFWSLTYIFIILRGFKDKTLAMPWAALCMNITWEFLFAFILPGPTQEWWYVNAAWFLLDVVILIQALLYGAKELPDFVPRNLFYPILAVSMVLSVIITRAMAERFPNEMPVYGAFVSNIAMSALFIGMLIRRASSRGQSMYIALSKLLGTLAAYLWAFNWPLMTPLYLPIFLLDVTYCVGLYKKLREEGLSPWRRV